MSQLIARQVISRLNMASSLVSPVGDITGDLMQLASADREKEVDRTTEAKVELASAYGFSSSNDDKPFAFAAGVAIIPIHGSLINRFGQSWGYVTGYNFIRSQLAMAMADVDVTAIILDCNSYGGEVTGCFETSDAIFEARGSKPIIAVIDANCYSACYAIASAADRIVCTPSGGAGSIGAVAMHISVEKMYADFGIKVTLIYSGDHKVDGNPYEDLPDSVKADIQRGVSASRSKFVTLVARNRGLDEQVVFDTQAALFRTDEALKLGLIDEVATPQNAVTALLNELSGSTETLEIDMHDEQAAAPGASSQQTLDASAVAKAERERCGAITSCEEAKGNPALASHIAFNTQMTVEEAKGMLTASSPAATVAEPTKATAPVVTTSTTNLFKEAMDADKQPNVGADGQAIAEAAEGTDRVKQILGSYKAMTGKDLA